MAYEKEYKGFVRSVALSNENRTFLNSDEDHAVDVLEQLFQLSKDEVRIFAGCLCKHVGNRTEYIVALSEFIERGGKLYILLNAYDEDAARKSSLYKRLAYYMADGKPIVVKSTQSHPYRVSDEDKKEVHFTVGDRRAYRIETDIENRTAECNFNNPVLAGETADFFDSLFNRGDAKVIDIVNLFSDGNK